MIRSDRVHNHQVDLVHRQAGILDRGPAGLDRQVRGRQLGLSVAAAQNAVNVADITAKIQGIQKILEHLTGGTDVSKPS